MGGEIILFLFLLRLALWAWKGWHFPDPIPPEGPPRGGRRVEAQPDEAPGEVATLPERPVFREAA